MNEPSFGFIGVKDLSKCYLPHQLNLGYAPSPFQGMCLADGFSQKIPFYSTGIRNFLFNRPDRVDMVNKKCLRAWSSGVESIWKREGVYGISTNTKEPRLLQPHYFDGKDFGKDFYVPFAQVMHFFLALGRFLLMMCTSCVVSASRNSCTAFVRFFQVAWLSSSYHH